MITETTEERYRRLLAKWKQHQPMTRAEVYELLRLKSEHEGRAA